MKTIQVARLDATAACLRYYALRLREASELEDKADYEELLQEMNELLDVLKD